MSEFSFFISSREPVLLRGRLTSWTKGGGEQVFRLVVTTRRSCSLCIAASSCHLPLRRQQTLTHLLLEPPLLGWVCSDLKLQRHLRLKLLTDTRAFCIRSDMPLWFKFGLFLSWCMGMWSPSPGTATQISSPLPSQAATQYPHILTSPINCHSNILTPRPP